ncbi:hypothetical protein BBH88_09960 [Planococcus antarcticus DSM 14505]|uniref:Major facilitator superfamily (MFS) profile domain-containing protein n=1 Tax=Planococcus antarcticus DSM 14505 TaxID=1185653 RepID=A0ABN4REZ8_9BACL|nr:hypothetical protein [Planococcus antarcticus]ANU10610.1 hypothetical protein BBH88_09960 [Planococcus antarcticus DSM 14505]
MITCRTAISLGVSQLVFWRIPYYLIAAFSSQIAEDLGWSGAIVYAGFATALVIMALASPLTGRSTALVVE